MGTIIDIVMDGIGAGNVDAPVVRPENATSFRDRIRFATSLDSLFMILGAVFFTGALANAGRNILMKAASERIITRLRNQLYGVIMKQDMAFYDNNRTGELISRLSTDTTVVSRSLTSNISDGLRSLLMSVIGLGAMVYVNAELTVFHF